MKNIIMSILLLLVSSVSFAGDLVLVNYNRLGDAIYLDKSSIVRDDKEVSVQVKVVSAFSVDTGKGHAKSYTSDVVFGCFPHNYKYTRQTVFYENSDFTGRVLLTQPAPGTTRVRVFQVTEGSMDWNIQQDL